MSDTTIFHCPVCEDDTPHLMGLMGGICPCVVCNTVLYCPWEDLRTRSPRPGGRREGT